MSFTGPIEDRIAIRELMESYACAVMEIDADAWGATWAEDAFWELPEVPDLEGFQGRAAIVQAWVGSMKMYGLEDCTKPMIYTVMPGRIAIEGDRAQAVCFTSEIYQDPETRKETRVRGRYDDSLVKAGGQWRFARRSYRIMHMAMFG